MFSVFLINSYAQAGCIDLRGTYRFERYKDTCSVFNTVGGPMYLSVPSAFIQEGETVSIDYNNCKSIKLNYESKATGSTEKNYKNTFWRNKVKITNNKIYLKVDDGLDLEEEVTITKTDKGILFDYYSEKWRFPYGIGFEKNANVCELTKISNP